MPGSNANTITNPAASSSGLLTTLLIEKFTGKVHMQYNKGENLKAYFDFQQVKNTNSISTKYIGETELQALVQGQEPDATGTEYDKARLTINTTVLARNTIPQLYDVQADIDGNKTKISKNQAGKLKKFEDMMLIQQMLSGILTNFESVDGGSDGGAIRPRVPGQGYSIKLLISEAQALLPNDLLASVEWVVEKMMESEGPELDEVACVLPWAYFNVLSDAERLVNKDYMTSSDVKISGFTLKRYNIPIIPSNRFPKVANSAGNRHLLSTPANSYRYDATAAMLNAVAILFTEDALICGTTIDLEGDIFFDKKAKTFFIDSWFAEGAIPDRYEAVGGVFTNGATENTVITARGKRKAIPTLAVS